MEVQVKNFYTNWSFIFYFLKMDEEKVKGQFDSLIKVLSCSYAHS